MAADTADEGVGGRFRHVRSWGLFALPPSLLVAVLTVEAAATALTLGSVVAQPAPGPTALLHTLVLVLLGVVHTECAVQAERVRRRIVSDFPHVGLTSVWTFAAALVLPMPLAAVVAIVVQSHSWLRTGRPRVAIYRTVFTTSTVVLSCYAAGAVVAGLGPRSPDGLVDLFVIVPALLVYTTVNSALVGGAIAMNSAQPRLASVLGDWGDNLLEFATLSVGALAAMALVIEPWLVLLVLPPVLVLHRAVLVRHLEERASTDGKTGLLNAAAWHTQAERELRRARRSDVPNGVLVVDLDHFKQVNDRHGHLAGDRALAAVAGALRAEVRERDLVGRFGGEEFVVLLAGGPTRRGTTEELTTVAERIRLRIADLRVEMPTPDGPLTVTGLSASVGVAFFPEHGTELRELLQVADTALYAAKRAGRNAVRAGVPAQRSAPVEQAETR